MFFFFVMQQGWTLVSTSECKCTFITHRCCDIIVFFFFNHMQHPGFAIFCWAEMLFSCFSYFHVSFVKELSLYRLDFSDLRCRNFYVYGLFFFWSTDFFFVLLAYVMMRALYLCTYYSNYISRSQGKNETVVQCCKHNWGRTQVKLYIYQVKLY